MAHTTHTTHTTPFTLEKCKGEIHVSRSIVTIEGKIMAPVGTPQISFIAAAPADFRASYSGSGLPFPSPAMALENTPNKGVSQLTNGNEFSIKIIMPNSYYAGHGTVLIAPMLYLTYTTSDGEEHTAAIKLEESIPYRTLTYPNGRSSASFYNVILPVRSQEQILRDSAYPAQTNLMPENHWGLKPPL